MRMRVALAFAVAALFEQGCGGVYYSATASAAASRLEHAKEIGAEQYAPYEYYFAKEHLYQARIEASDASYADAATYARTAEEYANKAIELSQVQARQTKAVGQ
jgi:hypothetical protein